MLETLAAVLGVVTGIWFLVEKLRPIAVHRKPKPDLLPMPSPATPRHGSTLEDLAATLSSQAARYQLYQPGPNDDPISAEQLGPWATTGDFFGTGRPAHALYVKNRDADSYSLIVVGSPDAGEPQVYNLDSDIHSARFMYVERARPGRYRVGPVVRKHGGPKSVKIPREGIVSGTYESAGRLIWWDKDERAFREQWLTD
jgi:hypothetical protein